VHFLLRGHPVSLEETSEELRREFPSIVPIQFGAAETKDLVPGQPEFSIGCHHRGLSGRTGASVFVGIVMLPIDFDHDSNVVRK